MMPYYRFPRTVRVVDLANTNRVLASWDLPLGEGIPIEGRADASARVPVGAQQPGSARVVRGARRRRPAPGGERARSLDDARRAVRRHAGRVHGARELVRVEHRARGVDFLADENALITYEYDRDRRWLRTLLHDLEGDAEPGAREPQPQRPLRRSGRAGTHVRPARTLRRRHGRRLGLPRGTRLVAARRPGRSSTARTSRRSPASGLWHCGADAYERVASVLPARVGAPPRWVTWHETPTSPPNLRLHGASDEARALTAFPRPATRAARCHARARALRARGRRAALRDALPARGLRGGHAAAAARVGLPAGVQRREHGRAGERQRRALHAHRGHLAPLPRDAGLRGAGRRNDARRRRPRDDERHVRRAARRILGTRPRSTPRSSEGVADPERVGDRRATATARS